MLLADAGEQLLDSLDMDRTVASVARLAVSSFADWCLVEIAGAAGGAAGAAGGAGRDSSRSWLALAPANPAHAALALELQTTLEQGAQRPWVADQALLSGALTHYHVDPTVSPVEAAGAAEAGEAAADAGEERGEQGDHLLPALGVESAIALPLEARGLRLGVITFVRCGPGHDYSAGDLALAQEFSRRAALAVANAQLHERVRDEVHARDEFLASFVHDLKNPITCIKAYSQLLHRQITRGGRLDIRHMAQRLDRMEIISNRLAEAIDEVLGAAQGQRGQHLELRRRPTDLVALVRQIVAEYGLAHEQVRFHLQSAVPRLTGVWDGARLERVVSNLLSNSVKYGGEDVTIAISTALLDGRTWAILRVSDQGIGIPAADLPHVFDYFRRAGNVEARRGAGIGLAAAKRIVEEHGGTIAVESKEGQGSTFTVRLPLNPPRTSGPTGGEEPEQPSPPVRNVSVRLGP